MPRIQLAAPWRQTGSLIVALIVACGLLVACGTGGNDDDTPPTPDATETPERVATALSGAPRIGAATWTSAVDPRTNAPIGDGTPVIGDTVIYAVFPIETLPAGTQLVASWYFNNTSLDALSSSMRIDQDRVSGWLEFHIERTGADPWPNGRYVIVVTDGTNELQRSEVTVS
ncbi:MAG: hypothetical protein KC438_08115 [Thermomicrobiales bacterium]|nr:hypothetical protein [Thermomicrobiales bacterium]MCO5221904.1 hypothetical protein [Thermomicrobiales bacterium]